MYIYPPLPIRTEIEPSFDPKYPLSFWICRFGPFTLPNGLENSIGISKVSPGFPSLKTLYEEESNDEIVLLLDSKKR